MVHQKAVPTLGMPSRSIAAPRKGREKRKRDQRVIYSSAPLLSIRILEKRSAVAQEKAAEKAKKNHMALHTRERFNASLDQKLNLL